MGPTEHTEYDLDVPFPLERVIAALTDFTDRRPMIWTETCHPRVYEVHRVGPVSAEVTEGVPFSWSRERYDWSEPGIVRLTQLDSNVAAPVGTIAYRVTPNADGSTHISCRRYRVFKGVRGRVAGTFMVMLGSRILRRQLLAGLARASTS